jgi:hypothetical protein
MSGFESDVKPLFRERDVSEMEFAFNLWDYEDVKANAAGILEKVEAGDMPCDEPWDDDKVAKFRSWVEGGMQP